MIVCSQPMKTDDRRLSCRQHHFHCSQCISEGCVLCQFQQIRARNEKNYRDLPPNSQQVIYACQIWEEKHEQAMMSNPNHSTRFHDDNNNNLRAILRLVNVLLLTLKRCVKEGEKIFFLFSLVLL